MLASLHGDIDQILQTKHPVEIEALLDTQPCKENKCVLVEGAPGVGKTTLSWEVCRRWSEGELFQQYNLVLLLRLRDETVQRATTLRDFISYMWDTEVDVERRHRELLQHLESSNGKHTLII